MKTLKIEELIGAKVGEEKLAKNGSKYKEVKIGDGVIGWLFSNKIGVDQNGKDVYGTQFSGNVRVIRTEPLELGQVSLFGKVYNLIEKVITKKDGGSFKRELLVDSEGNEVGIYGKAFVKKNGKYKFFNNRWMIRLQVRA